MPAQNLPGASGPVRIDINPQNPTDPTLPHEPRPATTAAHSPNTLVGDTSTAQIEVRQGWPFARPAEKPAVVLEGDIFE